MEIKDWKDYGTCLITELGRTPTVSVTHHRGMMVPYQLQGTTSENPCITKSVPSCVGAQLAVSHPWHVMSVMGKTEQKIILSSIPNVIKEVYGNRGSPSLHSQSHLCSLRSSGAT